MITTDISFPAGLPNPLREGYSLQPVSPFVRTPMESGRARNRRMFTNVPVNTTLDFIFKANEAAYFEIWFKETLKDGVEWFNIEGKTPLGMINFVCQFTDMYQGPELVGINHWRYSCPVEIWERPLMPTEWVEFPDYVLQASILDVAINHKWPKA